MLPGDFYKLRSRARSHMCSGRKESVQKNLDALRENTSKKTLAQKIYYDKHCQGRSPLLRDVPQKVPIHERLGRKDAPKKRVPYLGTSTNTLLPRRNRRSRRRRRHFSSHFSVQHRIDAIRQRQRAMLNSLNAARNVPSLDTSRNVPPLNTPSNVQSYKIQVINQEADQPSLPSLGQRFQMQLDYDIQTEIKQIQNSQPREIFLQLFPIKPAATFIPLNHRFSTLM